jgi:hypothetical protein
MSEQCQDIPQRQSNAKIYHNVRTMSRYTTMSEQRQDIPQRQSNVKIYHNVRAMSKPNRKLVETETHLIPLTHVYMTALISTASVYSSYFCTSFVNITCLKKIQNIKV